MRADSSADRTWAADSSTSLYTATLAMPSERSVLITRTAISPRFATRTLVNITPPLHPEDAVAGRLKRRVGRRGQREAEDPPGVGGVDDPVVPQPGRRVVRVALVLVLVADRLLERVLLAGGPVLAARLELIPPDRGEHARGLVAAHHGDPGVRPHPQEAGGVGPAAHRVVARAERAADDHRELRHPGAGDRGDHLGAVLGDAVGLVLPADHEAGDVLQEDEGNPALVAQLDEVRALERGLAEQDPVVGDNSHGMPVYQGEPGHQGRAVLGLELSEP